MSNYREYRQQTNFYITYILFLVTVFIINVTLYFYLIKLFLLNEKNNHFLFSPQIFSEASQVKKVVVKEKVVFTAKNYLFFFYKHSSKFCPKQIKNSNKAENCQPLRGSSYPSSSSPSSPLSLHVF